MARILTSIERVQKARIQLTIKHPFFGLIAMRLHMILSDVNSTAWVDGVTMGFNKKFIDVLTDAELMGVVAHEVMHVVLAHMLRKQNRNHRKFNRAGDYVINLILIDAKLELPDDKLYDTKYDNMITEAVYNLLDDESDDQVGGSGDTDDVGGCGVCLDATDKNGNKLGGAASTALENDIKVMVRQAATAAKKAGKLPGGVEALIEDLFEPQIDWQEVLQHFADCVAKNDFSYRKPHRRYMQQGIVVPTAFSNDLGELVVLIDTSGSIGHDQLVEFGTELSSILEEFSVVVHVIYVDTQVAGYEEFCSDDLPLVLHSKGGGGTDFSCVTEWLEENAIDPSAMVVFTDGYVYGSEYDGWFAEPEFPTICVLNHGNEVTTPDWMHTIAMT